MENQRITRFSWHIARLPFKQSVGHALKSRASTQSIIFRVIDQSGRMGYGEGAPRSYVTNELIDDSGPELDALLAAYPLPALTSLNKIRAYSAKLLTVTEYPAVVCAVETALLDLYGKQRGVHLNQLLPAAPAVEPTYSMVIPFMPLEQAARYVDYAAGLAIPHLKIKVGFADDVNFVRQLIEKIPASMEVRLDANRGWTYQEALEKCQSFRQLGIRYIEEPLKKDEADRLAELSRQVEVLLGLDESLYALEHARFYQKCMAPDRVYFNLKLSKCGGYLNTRKIWRFARNHGIPCQLGCNVGETAILSALGRAFAQRHPLRFLEGSFNSLLLEEDLTTDKLAFGPKGGAISIQRAGLGIAISPNHPLFN